MVDNGVNEAKSNKVLMRGYGVNEWQLLLSTICYVSWRSLILLRNASVYYLGYLNFYQVSTENIM